MNNLSFEDWRTTFYPRLKFQEKKQIVRSYTYKDYLWNNEDISMQHHNKIWSVVKRDLPTDDSEFDRSLHLQLVAGKAHDALHFMVTTLPVKNDVFVILN